MKNSWNLILLVQFLELEYETVPNHNSQEKNSSKPKRSQTKEGPNQNSPKPKQSHLNSPKPKQTQTKTVPDQNSPKPK